MFEVNWQLKYGHLQILNWLISSFVNDFLALARTALILAKWSPRTL